MPNNRSKELLPGTKKNKLTIINLHHKDKRWRRHYLCRCDCGIEKIIQGSLMMSGNTKSCGCLGREQRKIMNRLPNNGGVINHLILQYKRHAKNRKIDFNINRDTFIELIKQPCYYCGLSPSNNKITKNCKGFLYSGIDRLDSSKGYIINNVVSCCKKCNKAKLAMSKQDFLSWIKRVYDHSIKSSMANQWG